MTLQQSIGTSTLPEETILTWLDSEGKPMGRQLVGENGFIFALPLEEK